MTNAHQWLIKAVCERNWALATSQARASIANIKDDSSKASDIKFRDEMLALLDRKKTDFDALPPNLEGVLVVENPADTFHPGRYFLAPKEAEVAEEILRIDQAAERMSSLDIRFLNGTLLHGESGTGKTTFARYIAYWLGIPLVYLKFSAVISAYLGSSSSNITRAFDYVRPHRCVFMLDELDALGMRRGGTNSGGSATNELNRITITMMQCLDTLPNDVLVLAATNRPDVLDEAIQRRFFLKHEITRLNQEQRMAMAANYFNDVGYEPTEEELRSVAGECIPQSEIENRIIRVLVSHYTNGGQK